LLLGAVDKVDGLAEENKKKIRGDCLRALGNAYRIWWKHKDAKKYFDEAQTVLQSITVAADDWAGRESKAKLALGVGILHYDMRHLDESKQFLTQAYELFTEMDQKEHHSVSMGFCAMGLGNLHKARSEFKEAIHYFEASAKMHAKDQASTPLFAYALCEIVKIHLDHKNLDEAKKLKDTILREHERELGVLWTADDRFPREIAYLQGKGMSVERLRELVKELKAFELARVNEEGRANQVIRQGQYIVSIIEKGVDNLPESESKRIRAFSLRAEGNSYRELWKHKDARKYLLEAEQQFESVAATITTEDFEALHERAWLYTDLGRYHYDVRELDHAKQYLDKAIDIHHTLNTKGHHGLTESLTTSALAHVYKAFNNVSEAIKFFQNTYDIAKKDFPKETHAFEAQCEILRIHLEKASKLREQLLKDHTPEQLHTAYELKSRYPKEIEFLQSKVDHAS